MAACSSAGQSVAAPQAAGHHTPLDSTSWSRPDRQVTPAHIAARVLAAARDRMRRDWLLVGSDIRLFFFLGGGESLHVYQCQSCQQPNRQIKQTTGEWSGPQHIL